MLQSQCSVKTNVLLHNGVNRCLCLKLELYFSIFTRQTEYQLLLLLKVTFWLKCHCCNVVFVLLCRRRRWWEASRRPRGCRGRKVVIVERGLVSSLSLFHRDVDVAADAINLTSVLQFCSIPPCLALWLYSLYLSVSVLFCICLSCCVWLFMCYLQSGFSSAQLKLCRVKVS